MGRDGQSSKRVESLRVRLEPDMMRRFEKVAEDFGMAPSTMAAFVLAQYVRESERTVVQTVIAKEDGTVIGKGPKRG